MPLPRSRSLPLPVTMILLGILAASAWAQTLGPDLIVAEIQGVQNYAHDAVLGVDVFSFGTIACNLGQLDAPWSSASAAHPVIALDLFRLLGDRFESIGTAWVRHPFFAASGTYCGSCNGQFGSVLGVGCSDPSSAGLNGGQSAMAPRSDVNASTGVFPYPPVTPAFSGGIERRLRVKLSDLGLPGARYFVQAQYVSAADASSGHATNDVSWREVHFSPAAGGFNAILSSEPTHVGEPAIRAWEAIDPAVRIVTVDLPGDGRVLVGLRVRETAAGGWSWNLTVQNQNSDLSVGKLSLPRDPGTLYSNLSFHDVDPHSGDPTSGTDWTAVLGPTDLSWACEDYATNPNGNAIRWGHAYRFGFEADTSPNAVASLTLRLFRPTLPGQPSSVNLSLQLPERLYVVAGADQVLDVLESTPQPFQVKVADASGQPQPNRSVTFSVVSGPLLPIGPTTVLTNAAGMASMSFQALGNGGPARVRAAIPTDAVEADFFVRRYLAQFLVASGSVVIDLVTPYPNMPFVVASDWPQPQAIPTPFGPICTSVLSPGPHLIVAGGSPGYGLYLPELTTDAAGHFTLIAPGFGVLAGTGFTYVTQVYALTPPGSAQPIYVSNCPTLVF